jgi:hypothetical protein
MSTNELVQIPSRAVADEDDLGTPVTALLHDLNLLGTDERDGTGFRSAFFGPPQSVAVIEAGATAASKWWASGLGTTVIATWGAVAIWWPKQGNGIEEVVIGGAALLTAVIAASIGYLIASDVRARSAASVSTTKARADIAIAMIRGAQALYTPAGAAATSQIVPLPEGIRVRYLSRPAEDEEGWLVIAMERQADGSLKFVVVKGSSEATASASDLQFGAPA